MCVKDLCGCNQVGEIEYLLVSGAAKKFQSQGKYWYEHVNQIFSFKLK